MTNETPDDPETTELDTSKLVSPNEDTSKERTPIGDSLDPSKRELVEEEDEPDEDDDEELDEDSEFPPLEKAKSYKIDVKRALERETQDGKGEDEVPESDFVSFATDGVEKED